jgi:hypothetical protein
LAARRALLDAVAAAAAEGAPATPVRAAFRRSSASASLSFLLRKRGCKQGREGRQGRRGAVVCVRLKYGRRGAVHTQAHMHQGMR